MDIKVQLAVVIQVEAQSEQAAVYQAAGPIAKIERLLEEHGYEVELEGLRVRKDPCPRG